ncbi:MAG: hypothetical protein QOI59_2977 [Gammaproteobacteria bacterium]|jgi:hypothetical protein|nr:hypothetical protein [Gammaproteobacteria bacterium]
MHAGASEEKWPGQGTAALAFSRSAQADSPIEPHVDAGGIVSWTATIDAETERTDPLQRDPSPRRRDIAAHAHADPGKGLEQDRLVTRTMYQQFHPAWITS